MRTLIFIETTDENLAAAITALLPPEEARPDNTAYFSADAESLAPLGTYTAQIAAALCEVSEKVSFEE